MKTIATFDIGTTAVKGVLIDANGCRIMELSAPLDTLRSGEAPVLLEQNPCQWYDVFCSISRRFVESGDAGELIGIVLSGQMQDLILLDEAGNPVMNAILYADGRAAAEAAEIAERIGRAEIERVTGNQFDGSRPLAKLMWVKRHLPDAYRLARHVLVSAKDYVVAQLAGVYSTDMTSASTAGLMDIEAGGWKTEWLAEVGLISATWARLYGAHRCVGHVGARASMETGYPAGTPVYAGAGDAGATTLASGILADGEYNINLGTSGWVAGMSKTPLRADGVSNLAAMPQDMYINVVPFFNAGNVHRWAADTFCEGDTQDERFAALAGLAASAAPGSLLFLPYLVGERFPVMDADAAGCFVDVRPGTGRAQMARAALEGVAFSIRQGVEAMGKKPSRYTLVGGGARCTLWCQILADMLRMPVQVYRDATYLPAMALAAAVLVGRGELAGYQDFPAMLERRYGSDTYQPNEAAANVYDRLYPRFASIYPALKGMRLSGQ